MEWAKKENISNYQQFPNGKIDVSKYLNDAIKKSQSSSVDKELFIPAGRYLIEDSITPAHDQKNKGNVCISGEGMGRTIILNKSKKNAIDIRPLSGYEYTQKFITISNLTVDAFDSF
jgi:hypothetical protein